MKYNSKIVTRNIRTRLASLGMDISKLAKQLGVSRQAIYKRLSRISKRGFGTVDIYWWCTVLVLYPEQLTADSPKKVLESPELPIDWLYRVKPLLHNEEFDYDQVVDAAFS